MKGRERTDFFKEKMEHPAGVKKIEKCGEGEQIMFLQDLWCPLKVQIQ